MNTLSIAKELALPLDAVTQKLAWLGRTGSGKTFACKRMVEQMLYAGAQVVIIDAAGVWPGLRLGPHSFDIPVLGGLHGDIPLEPTAGALIADVIVRHGTSMVLDVSQMLDAERTRFATAFGGRFFQLKKASPSAVHLVLEECQEFVPQNFQSGEERMLHEFVRLAKQGRASGIGISFLSQRPQEINKKALNQSECVFAFQMTGPQERKALEYWLADKGFDGKLSELLPHLEVGAPHVWSPQWLKISKTVHILPIDSLDTSRTPKVGEKKFTQNKLKPIDLGELNEAMKESVEKAKADDPKTLRARIAELEKELAKKPAGPTKTQKIPVVDQAAVKRLSKFVQDVRGAADRFAELVSSALKDADGALEQARKEPSPTAMKEIEIRRNVLDYLEKKRTKPNGSKAPSGEQPSAPERRLLIALAQYGRPLAVPRLALRSVYTVNGHFNNILGGLRAKRWAQGRGEVEITSEGLAALGPFEPLPAGADLFDYWKRKLGGPEGRLLDALQKGEEISVPELAERAGYTVNGHFNNVLGHLRALELVTGRGSVRISEELL